METVNISVTKNAVYDEVAKTTSYVGAKAAGDGSLYERVFTTEDDRQMLERFWTEACDTATGLLMPFIITNGSTGTQYAVTLSVSGNFDTALNASINSSLFSFLTAAVTGKWCRMAAPESAESYFKDAEAALTGIRGKLWFRKKPTRKHL